MDMALSASLPPPLLTAPLLFPPVPWGSTVVGLNHSFISCDILWLIPLIWTLLSYKAQTSGIEFP